MSANLPINLSKSGLSKPQISAHAQNFSTSMLGQKRDILSAKTSVEKTKGGSENLMPTSSISRLGERSGSAGASTRHQDIDSILEENEKVRDEVRERLRYNHIRQLMKDKKNNKNNDKK